MSKIFIDNVNSYLGHALVEEFRNDHIDPSNPNKFLATLSSSEFLPPPSNIEKILNVTFN